MKIIIKINQEELRKDLFFREIYQIIRVNKWNWRAVTAVIALPGSIFSSMIGAVFYFIGWVIPASHFSHLLSKTSLFCFILTLPLLIIGSHCLDILEKQTAV